MELIKEKEGESGEENEEESEEDDSNRGKPNPPKKISTPIVLIPLGIKSSRSARLLTFLPKTSLAMYMVLYYDEKVFIFFSQASNHHVHEKCYG